MEQNIGKVYVVGGLHNGDQGKGTTVDYLAKQVDAKAVVRYGGGPQAAHHVVTSSGVWHCFSHYGSGMFVDKCVSVLSRFMLVYPQTLVRQSQKLQTYCKDPIKRLKIDLQCYLITPYHQLISRIFELLRSIPKGSTGLGGGRTVQDVYGTNPTFFPKSHLLKGTIGTCLQIKDIIDKEKCDGLLQKVFDEKVGILSKLMKMTAEEVITTVYSAKELSEFDEKPSLQPTWKKLVLDELMAYTNKQSQKSLANCIAFYDVFRQEYGGCFTNTVQYIGKTLKKGRNVIFEGSQGALLDPIHGYFPFVTKTICTDDNARKILSELKVQPAYKKYGALRCYSTRHGAGPFVSYDAEYTNLLKEDHNRDGQLQGGMKAGPFDLVAANYGIQIFKPDVLSLTCVDRVLGLEGQMAIKIVSAYEISKSDAEEAAIAKYFEYKSEEQCYVLTTIRLIDPQEAAQNVRLAQLLMKCRPRFTSLKLPNKSVDFLKRTTTMAKLIGQLLELPVAVVSISPTRQGKLTLLEL